MIIPLLGLFLRYDFFDPFLQIWAVDPDLSLAGIAFDAKIHSRPHDGEAVSAAGVGLFQFDDIAHIQFQRHKIPP